MMDHDAKVGGGKLIIVIIITIITLSCSSSSHNHPTFQVLPMGAGTNVAMVILLKFSLATVSGVAVDLPDKLVLFNKVIRVIRVILI